MTPTQAYRVLAKALAYDRRRGTVDDTDAVVWAEGLDGCDLDDCLAAVTDHYREQTEMAMVADIRHRAQAIARRRAGQQRAALLATTTAPDGTPLAITSSTAEPARDRTEATRALIRQVAGQLPEMTAHDRAVRRARAERGRAATSLTRPRQQDKPVKPKRIELPKPATSEARAMARAYLDAGWEPAQVSERLGISAKWCRKLARDLDIDPEQVAERHARQLRQKVKDPDQTEELTRSTP